VALHGRPDGDFAYQVRRGHRVRTRFARWSCAWMLCALCDLGFAMHERATPAGR
jgi:hypothetical protein